ncbi:MAG: PKD domain-containing protein, partial [Gammaproteobacteria bacterium]
GPDQSTVGGNTITVDATNSSSTGSVITQYTFEQVSGIPQEITQSTPGQIEITAPSDGDDITIKVTVTDDEANSSSDFVVIVVNAPPLASIQVQNTTVSPGTTVTLDGANSSDRDGHIIQYMWTQTDGPSVVLQNAASATSTFTTPNEDTTLAFRLSVTDDAGVTASSDVSITVQSSTARSSGESRGGSLNLLPILSLFVLLFTAGRLTSRHRAEQ